MVILVTVDRVVYDLDLQCLKLENGILGTIGAISSPYRPDCFSGHQISRNGSQIIVFYISCSERPGTTTRGHTEEHSAVLDIAKTRLELRMFDISGTTNQVRILELEFAEPRPPISHRHVIRFSPDLSIVQAGADVFDLLSPGHPRLLFPDNPLEKTRQGKHWSITFSSCNRYLVLIENKDNNATDGFATYGIFRVYRAVGKIEKVVIPGLDDLVADGFSAAFHPEIPLLVLTYFTRPEPGARNTANYINAIEIELEGLKPDHINIPKREPRVQVEKM